jgi:D-cysteine desulfhydrase
VAAKLGMKSCVVLRGNEDSELDGNYFLDKLLGAEVRLISAVGSGGTYAGQFLGNKLLNNDADICGINVCDDEEYFKNRVYDIIQESFDYLECNLSFSKEEIHIIDGYVGRGYALSRAEELKFIYDLAKLEGIILDPVYTGKAMYELVEEIKKGSLKQYK